MGVLLLGAITAGVFGYLTYSPSGVMLWQNGAIAASWVFAAACVWQFWNRLEAGLLDWNGLSWHWVTVAQAGDDASQRGESVGSADQKGVISVRFDGRRCMLIKLEMTVGQARWLWLEQGFVPQRWHDVRRALYSRAKAPVFNTTHAL